MTRRIPSEESKRNGEEEEENTKKNGYETLLLSPQHESRYLNFFFHPTYVHFSFASHFVNQQSNFLFFNFFFFGICCLFWFIININCYYDTQTL